MKKTHFQPTDFPSSILSVFDISGTMPNIKDDLSTSPSLECDMERLHNDQMLLAEDYKKAVFRLRMELEKTLEAKK